MKTRLTRLMVALSLLALPVLVRAQFSFMTNSGVITITGYNTAAGLNAVIPAATNGYPVTGIGADAFEGSGLTGVTIPDSVTSIGDYAFYSCSSLLSVSIGNGVTNIGDNAFLYCTNLTAITVGTRNSAYSDLDGVIFNNDLTTLVEYPEGIAGDYTIPDGVTRIANSAFYDCAGLTSVTIPDSVASIGNDAFDSCPSLISAAIGNSVTSIGAFAFDSCPGLTSVTIPASVTNLGSAAFIYCTSLTNATIGDSVISIGNEAFYGCPGLTSVTIPNRVTSIGNDAFGNCISLAGATIGTSVTNIGGSAFADCYSLMNVSIPASVTSIGVNAFAHCTSLGAINVAATNPAYRSYDDGVLFDKALMTLIQFPGGMGGVYIIPNSVTSIGDNAFAGSGLTGVTIPNSVTSIGVSAFAGTGLTSVIIPNSVTNLGFFAFDSCPGLTSVTIGNGFTSLGDYAFEDCGSLTSVYFQGNAPSDDGTVFSGDTATVYYLDGTLAWGSTFGGVAAVLWNPLANTFSLSGGHFGFNITGPANAAIVVQVCTNLSKPAWLSVSTNTLSSLGRDAFTDNQFSGYPNRFYRFRSP